MAHYHLSAVSELGDPFRLNEKRFGLFRTRVSLLYNILHIKYVFFLLLVRTPGRKESNWTNLLKLKDGCKPIRL